MSIILPLSEQVSSQIRFVSVGNFQIAILERSVIRWIDQIKSDLTYDEIELARQIQAPERQWEFVAGRWLFHKMTGHTGSLLKEKDGCPKWPNDIWGGISHKKGHVAFSWIDQSRAGGLGIDLELIGLVGVRIEPKILSSDESLLVDALCEQYRLERTYFLTVIFSFKEALYKAHYLQGRTFFYFHDVAVSSLDPIHKTIQATTKVATASHRPSGQLVTGSYIVLDIAEQSYVLSLALADESPKV